MLDLNDYFEEYVDHLVSEKDASTATITSYSGDFNVFKEFLRKYNVPSSVNDISTSRLRKYLTFLKKEKGYSLESIRRKIHSLRSFFKFLESQDYITSNPASKISAPKSIEKVPKYMVPEEIKKLIKATMLYGGNNALRDKCLIEMFVYSGMRRNE